MKYNKFKEKIGSKMPSTNSAVAPQQLFPPTLLEQSNNNMKSVPVANANAHQMKMPVPVGVALSVFIGQRVELCKL